MTQMSTDDSKTEEKAADMIRTKQHTAFAALWATGAELSRRGYAVTFTLGNTPRINMLCAVPGGEAFVVQVKGISYATGFYIDKSFFEGSIQPNLILVVVLVPPPDDNSPMRFFVLSHQDAVNEFAKMRKVKKDGTPYEEGFGLNWGSVKGYEKRWDKFPSVTV